MLFSLWSSYGKNTYEYTVRLLISKNLCAMYWTVSNYFSFKKIFRRKIILNMWNVKMNVWLINFFATPKFYSFWWLLFPWILLEKVCAWGWRPLRLETDIEKKIKTEKRLFEETNWRFGFDATYIRNVTVIIFEDCNDEGHVPSAVYKVWSVTYSKKKGNLKTQDVNRSPNL